MTDSVFENNTAETATDLGNLAATGADFDVFTTSRIFDFDSVGMADPEMGSFTTDVTDFFTFDPLGLSTITINFNADTIGNFINFLFVLPVSGVTGVTGALVAGWSGGDQVNEADPTPAPIPFLGSATVPPGLLPPGIGLAGATINGNEFGGSNAVWTLGGGPVVFQVFGVHFDYTTDSEGEEIETTSEVDYRFTIEPGMLAPPPPAPPPPPDPDPDPTTVPPPGPPPDPVPLPPVVHVNDLDQAETVVGGGGIDTYIAVAPLADLTIEVLTNGDIRITDELFPENPDTLINFERIELFEGFLAFDTDGNAGQAYRLYEAAFNRQPDSLGLGFWIDNYDDGNVDLVQMAEFFMQSEEFEQLYGAPETLSDFDFLTLLYANVLDRTPDQAGFEFWTEQQQNGISRAEILQYFSESTENYANVADTIAGGIFYL